MRLPIPVLLALLVLPSLARGQVAFDQGRNQAIGAVAGLASASGLAYQEILPSAFGYRATVFGWKTGGSSFLAGGVSGLRVLSDDSRRRIYLIAGVSYWRWSSEETVTDFDSDGNVAGERRLDDVKDSWSAGFGPGLELPLGDRSTVSLEGLFTYWARTGDFLPLPQVAVHYLF